MPQPNGRNIWVSIADIEGILHKYGGHRVKNLSVFQLAFVHRSYVKLPDAALPDSSVLVPPQSDSNERLEFLGDCVLSCVVGKYLFDRYPDQMEGFLTKIRTKIVRSETLARLSKKLNLGRFVLLSNYIEDSCNGRRNQKILEDTFEAFIGALYLDSEPHGFQSCNQFITALVEDNLDMSTIIYRDDNYKDQLLRYYQKTFGGRVPKYRPFAEHLHLFEMAVLDPTGKVVGVGKAKKKVAAEQLASREALVHFGEPVLSEPEPDSDDDFCLNKT
ncbi:MAG: ribonuclease III family protein [Sulfobacillus sp.]